eukprot:1942546-Pleurochrysis_carterae.AAC.1
MPAQQLNQHNILFEVIPNAHRCAEMPVPTTRSTRQSMCRCLELVQERAATSPQRAAGCESRDSAARLL